MAGLGRGNTLRRLTECEPRPKGAVESAMRRYRVVYEDSGWVSLGPIILDAPP
jgi:hypothetical protein